MRRRLLLSLCLAASLATPLLADSAGTRPKISKNTRVELIRLMNAEFAWVKTTIPRSEKGLRILPDGKVEPFGRDMQMEIAKWGPMARPGERVQITNVEIHDKKVLLDLNGGYIKKPKWYQRIQVIGNGGASTVAPGPDNSRAKGTTLTIEFKRHVPEMTATELKQLISPLLDFTVKSAAQAYTETLPKIVQDAIKEKRVLVGMNKEMVTYAKGRPPQRVREKDENGSEYEEWIYGAPPQDVEFVRFSGEEVTQLKIMKVSGEKLVKTEREVKIVDPALAAAAKQDEETAGPSPDRRAPSLRRPGEAVDTGIKSDSVPGPVIVPPRRGPTSDAPTGVPDGAQGPPL